MDLCRLQSPRVRYFKGLCELVYCLPGPFRIWNSLVGRGIRVGGCSWSIQASVAKSATPQRLDDGYTGFVSIYAAQNPGINDHNNGL